MSHRFIKCVDPDCGGSQIFEHCGYTWCGAPRDHSVHITEHPEVLEIPEDLNALYQHAMVHSENASIRVRPIVVKGLIEEIAKLRSRK